MNYIDSIVTSLYKHLNRDNVTIPTLMDNGKEVSDDLDKAEILNSQFKSVFTREPITSELPNKDISPRPDISHKVFLNLLSTLNIHKACGPDIVNAILLKQISLVIALF